MSSTPRRKDSHLDLTATQDVGFRNKTNLFDAVSLIHNSLPELSLDEIDTSTTMFGKPLRAPLLIASMTGGSDRARTINRVLAAVAEERGYGFGLGSQRAMVENPAAVDSYRVRQEAPSALLLGNIGMVQAIAMSTDDLARLVADVGADALCVHLNPAHELTQPEGDRDFRGGIELFQRLTNELGLPVLAKETGAGLSLDVARRLAAVGVKNVDVGGAGGTSFVAVETLRLAPDEQETGHVFRDWGIPTAASLLAVSTIGFESVVATGGLRTGLEVAKAIALGATCAGIARPVFQAQQEAGAKGVHDFLDQVERQLRMAMLLVGARNLQELRMTQRVIHDELRQWMPDANAS
ncbi:MAG: isopentenyl-diphosphate delta-isomerase [Planctomycetota bacterium]|jgi:isopentenyl-diphosphate delta-isomerase